MVASLLVPSCARAISKSDVGPKAAERTTLIRRQSLTSNPHLPCTPYAFSLCGGYSIFSTSRLLYPRLNCSRCHACEGPFPYSTLGSLPGTAYLKLSFTPSQTRQSYSGPRTLLGGSVDIINNGCDTLERATFVSVSSRACACQSKSLKSRH